MLTLGNYQRTPLRKNIFLEGWKDIFYANEYVGNFRGLTWITSDIFGKIPRA